MYDPQNASNGIDSVVSKVETVFRDSPLVYKSHIVRPKDNLLVIGGIKASTEFVLLGDTYTEEELRTFKEVLDSTGLRLSDLKTRMVMGYTRRNGLVYNPETLREHTVDSQFAPPYNPQMSIENYIEEAKQQGYPMGGVDGKINSFPESAIDDFIEKSKHPHLFGFLEFIHLKKVETVYLGDEGYWFYSPPKQDVIEREQQKKSFFEALNENVRFRQIMESDELERSQEEHSKRSPPQARRH